MAIIIMFFNLFIFVVVACIITRNIINVKSVSDSFRTIYREEKEELYNLMSQKKNSNDNVNFEASIELNSNPIKEKKGKRSNI